MIRRPPRSTLFPTRRSSDLGGEIEAPCLTLGDGAGDSRIDVKVPEGAQTGRTLRIKGRDRKSTRLNSSHANISYAVFCLKKKNEYIDQASHVYRDCRFMHVR